MWTTYTCTHIWPIYALKHTHRRTPTPTHTPTWRAHKRREARSWEIWERRTLYTGTHKHTYYVTHIRTQIWWPTYTHSHTHTLTHSHTHTLTHSHTHTLTHSHTHTLTHAHIQCAHKQKEKGTVFEKLKVARSCILTGELSVDLTIFQIKRALRLIRLLASFGYWNQFTSVHKWSY